MNSLTDKKILIVDSSELFLQILGPSLAKRSAEIKTAMASDVALLTAIHWRPDLIITGVQIGNINGYDLCLILKLMPDYAGIPVILISGDDPGKVAHCAASAGADYYVPKDQQLFTTINQLVDQRLLPAESETCAVAGHRALECVLVVDDSSIIRRIISNILRALGVKTIIEAHHGQDGLSQLQANPVDLIITDWNMPVMDGLDMVRTIRKDPRHANMPIMMVTTEGGAREIAESREAGVNQHICKPFSIQTIRDALSQLGIDSGA